MEEEAAGTALDCAQCALLDRDQGPRASGGDELGPVKAEEALQAECGALATAIQVAGVKPHVAKVDSAPPTVVLKADEDACVDAGLIDTFEDLAGVARKESIAALELNDIPRVGECITLTKWRDVNDGDGDGGGSRGGGRGRASAGASAPLFLPLLSRARGLTRALILRRDSAFGEDGTNHGVGLLLLVKDLAEGAL